MAVEGGKAVKVNYGAAVDGRKHICWGAVKGQEGSEVGEKTMNMQTDPHYEEFNLLANHQVAY